MSREFDFLVFIGRFEPLHNGHVHIINKALQLADRLILLIGSPNVAPSPRNPWTYQTRVKMIRDSCASGAISDGNSVIIQTDDLPYGNSYANYPAIRIVTAPLPDVPYNDAEWINQVHNIVHDVVIRSTNDHPAVTIKGTSDSKIGLIGYSKDATSYYLKKFPKWRSVNVNDQHAVLASTDIRNQFFQRAPILPDLHLTPKAVCKILVDYMFTEDFKTILAETEFVKKYKDSWKSAPFPPTIACVDAVVVQSGYILLGTRKYVPGKGLLCLPGGHVNQDEFFRDAAIRELKEETRISDDKGEIPPAMLQSFITHERLFDDPNRSQRGRVMTMAYKFELPERKELFKVRGDDDVEHAKWYQVSELKQNMFYEDHSAIISEMTGMKIPL